MSAVEAWVPLDTFGTRLAIVRQRLGLNLTQAAALCGIPQGTWFKWENGSFPRELVRTVNVIVEATGVDRDWLLLGGPLGQEGDLRSKWHSPDDARGS